jgi:hypothetical protein
VLLSSFPDSSICEKVSSLSVHLINSISYVDVAFAPVLLERKAARIRKSMAEDTTPTNGMSNDVEKGVTPNQEGMRKRHVRTVFENGDRQYVSDPLPAYLRSPKQNAT